MPRRLSKPRLKQRARLVALCESAGLSQVELDKHLRVSSKTVAYWEASSTPLPSDVLPGLAKALGTGRQAEGA